MRIIAGERRGLRLKTIRQEGFRPTLDRVKESIFGILEPHLEAAKVLDLFAGSGALSLEALSRGAESALMFEVSKAAVKVIMENVRRAHYEDRCRVECGDFKLAGKRVARGERFDLVFADPPYEGGFAQQVLDCLRTAQLLAAEGLLVLEMSRKESQTLDTTGFELLRDRKYGHTVVWFLRKSA